MNTSPSKKSQRTGDHISNLHESVIGNILSRLPLKQAVQTSILSKDWEFKWTSICDINFVDNQLSRRASMEAQATFPDFMDRLLRCIINIRCLYVKTRIISSPNRVTTWITNVLKRKIETFKIFVSTGCDEKAIVLPFSLITNISLRTLALYVPCTLNSIDANNVFPNLISLCLDHVLFVNGNSDIDTMSLSFPFLETFETKLCNWVNVKFVEVYAPALRTFDSYTSRLNEVREYSIKILAPSLAEFRSQGSLPENIVLDGGSEVVCANLDNEHRYNKDYTMVDRLLLQNNGIQVGNLLNTFSSLEELTLSAYLAVALQLGGLRFRRFSKLRRFSMSSLGNTREVFELIFKLLNAAPKLEYLYIDVTGCGSHVYDAMESMPCIVSYLAEVKIGSFYSEQSQFELVKFLLKNGGALKKLSFWPVRRESERKRIVKKLSKFPRRQTSLSISFSRPDSTIVLA